VTARPQDRRRAVARSPRAVGADAVPPPKVRQTADPSTVGGFEEFSAPRVRSDQVLVGAALCLLMVGLVMVYSVSSAVGFFRTDGDVNFYFRQQTLVALAGLVVMVLVSRIDYRRYRRWAGVIALAAVALMALVHVPSLGREAGGATRWLALGPIPLQPSEVAKLAVIIIAARTLATRRAQSRTFEGLLWPLAPAVIAVCALILAQRDLGTAFVVGVVTMGLLWVAGMRTSQWLGLVAAGTGLAVLAVLTTEYRRERFFAFLDPFAQAQDSGFQMVQSMLAMGSGGWFGVGPGLSVQKFSYLPEAHTDMILAVLGEELGLVGVGLVIALFVGVAAAGLSIARRCREPFGRYLAAGCTFLIVGQAGINMGGVMGAIPLTGVPLPFISYGRTNLLVVLVALGLILSVARFGPQAVPVPVAGERQEHVNVTHIDSRRRYGGPRGARPSHR
jgi:cell division protein FtsW